MDLGTNHEGWSERRARVELEKVMGQIERGTWEPPGTPAPVEYVADETVQVTASRWWFRRRDELGERTRTDYRWRLDHVLRELGREPTGRLTPRKVDEARERLVKRGLGARSVNMVLALLAQVLDDAVEYGLLEANPARGRRRRMREPRQARSFLEPDMVLDVLELAREWEAGLPEHQRYGRRALLALLCLAGPRIGEAITADRGDFDLAGGRWRIPASKTEAGARDVELPLFLADELREHVAARARARGPMFPTRTGGRLNASNVRTRLLAGVVERVNKRRAKVGQMLLPARVTPHALRRTFASLALLAGRDPRFVMGQIGHVDARLTLSVYAQTVQRQRVDHELVWRLMRFADEPENPPRSRGFRPANGPTSENEASERRGIVPGE